MPAPAPVPLPFGVDGGCPAGGGACSAVMVAKGRPGAGARDVGAGRRRRAGVGGRHDVVGPHHRRSGPRRALRLGRRHDERRLGPDQRLLEPPGAAVQRGRPAARDGGPRRRQPRGAVRRRGGHPHRHHLRRRRRRQRLGGQVLRQPASTSARSAFPASSSTPPGSRVDQQGRVAVADSRKNKIAMLQRPGRPALRVRLPGHRAERAEDPARDSTSRPTAGSSCWRATAAGSTSSSVGATSATVGRPLPGAGRRQPRADRAPDHRRGDRGQHRAPAS